MKKPGRLSKTGQSTVRRGLMIGISLTTLALVGAGPSAAQNAGPTAYYNGVAVIGDPVVINLGALDKLGPPPNMQQLLRQPAVVVGAGSPVTQRGAVLTGQPPISGLTANAPQLLQAPSTAPRSGLVPGTRLSPNTVAAAPRSQLETATPSPAPRIAAAPAPASPRVATPPPPQPSQPNPQPVAAAAPSPAPAAVAAARPAPPPPPAPVAAAPRPTPAPAPAPVAAAPKPAPVAAAPKPTPVPAAPSPAPTPAPVAAAPKPTPVPATPAPTPAPVAAGPSPAPATPTITPPPSPQPATAEASRVEIPKLEAPTVAAAAPTPAPTPQATANVPQPAAATQSSSQVAALNPNAVVEGSDQLTINFASASSELPAGASPALDRLADRLTASPDLRIVLQGFASNDGETASQSRRLSLFRALAVRTYLIKKGVRSTRMDVRALGNKVEGGEPNRVDVVLPQAAS